MAVAYEVPALRYGIMDGPDHVIPGHGPLILKTFPPLDGNPEIVRLDLRPII